MQNSSSLSFFLHFFLKSESFSSKENSCALYSSIHVSANAVTSKVNSIFYSYTFNCVKFLHKIPQFIYMFNNPFLSLILFENCSTVKYDALVPKAFSFCYGLYYYYIKNLHYFEIRYPQLMTKCCLLKWDNAFMTHLYF